MISQLFHDVDIRKKSVDWEFMRQNGIVDSSHGDRSFRGTSSWNNWVINPATIQMFFWGEAEGMRSSSFPDLGEITVIKTKRTPTAWQS